jgi:hypothetical protein
MKLVVLIATTTFTVAIGAGALAWADDSGHLLAAGAAVILCLPPAMVTFLLVEAVRRKSPGSVPAVVIVGTGLRMGAAVIGALLLGGVLARAGVSRERFSAWLTCVYLLTLAIESGLLILGAGERTPQPESTGAA